MMPSLGSGLSVPLPPASLCLAGDVILSTHLSLMVPSATLSIFFLRSFFPPSKYTSSPISVSEPAIKKVNVSSSVSVSISGKAEANSISQAEGDSLWRIWGYTAVMRPRE